MNPILRHLLLLRQSKIIVPYYTEGVENVAWVEGYTRDGGIYDYSKAGNRLYIKAEFDVNAAEGTWVTDAQVDLSIIKTLYIDWQSEGVSPLVHLNASSSKTGRYFTFNAQVSQSGVAGRHIASLDVSSLSGLYYLRVHSSAIIEDRISILSVYRLWGEA